MADGDLGSWHLDPRTHQGSTLTLLVRSSILFMAIWVNPAFLGQTPSPTAGLDRPGIAMGHEVFV